MVTNLPAMQEMWIRSLDQEDPPEKGMAIHSSILAWEIPWMGRLAGYSPCSCSPSLQSWVAKSRTQLSTHRHISIRYTSECEDLV